MLFLGAVLDGLAWIRLLLLFGTRDMLELLEGFGYVARHGEVDLSSFIVPIQRDADVLASVPFSGDLVVMFQRLFEM